MADLIRRAPLLTAALHAARASGPPDWLLCAGAIRDAVWDLLHGREPAPPQDVDLGFFDPGDLSEAREAAVAADLRRRAPGIPWDARNQAAVHLWYPARFGLDVPPFASTAEAVATFPETASCIGVRLLGDDDLVVVAPHGLDDLLGCVCRHNPTRVSADFYEQRVASHDWRARWAKLRYIAAA